MKTEGAFTASKTKNGDKMIIRFSSWKPAIRLITSIARCVSNVIDGEKIANQITQELRTKVMTLSKKPGLAVILVGNRRDSIAYIRMKRKACLNVGIDFMEFQLSPNVTMTEMISKIDDLNDDSSFNGILVQLPLPNHIIESEIIERIHPLKDVDGLGSCNLAKLARTQTHVIEKKEYIVNKLDFHVSCTAQGVIELLDRCDISLQSKNVVIMGRSNIVGIPTALLAMQKDATVTIVHSKSRGIEDLLKLADIVIVAIGRPEYVQGHWLKPGAVVVDVGINSIADANFKSGYRLVGDCDFRSCSEVASYITPVPRGVGPMTIAMLVRNTVNAYIMQDTAVDKEIPS